MWCEVCGAASRGQRVSLCYIDCEITLIMRMKGSIRYHPVPPPAQIALSVTKSE